VEETRRVKKHSSKQRRRKRKEKRRITRGGRRKRSRHGIFPLWNSGRESGLKCRSPRVLRFGTWVRYLGSSAYMHVDLKSEHSERALKISVASYPYGPNPSQGYTGSGS
jgi:hypothetical protein